MKNFRLFGLLFILQVVSFLLTQTVFVIAREDCTTYRTIGWQCTAGGDPYYWFVLSFLVLPPLFAKLLLSKLGRKVAWRKLILTHAALAALILIIIAAVEFFSPQSGA